MIDVLPDREKKTCEHWLKAHPGVEVISRDRASVYADAASVGAPQATQVADRFHLLVNLRDHLKSCLDQKRVSFPKVELDGLDLQVGDQAKSSSPEVQALAALMRPLGSEQAAPAEQQVTIASFIRDTKREKHFHAPRPAVLAQSQVKRSARVARFEQVRALHQQGLSISTIAHCLGMSRASVSTFVQAETLPEQAPRPRQGREGKLDPSFPI